MFKKIQKYLLIHHPLLWNTKIVPLTVIAILLHIIYFILGYADGAIDFTYISSYYDLHENEKIIIVFSGLTSALTLVIWLVYYFKNNAFKSFYPKKTMSLYKEWLLILFGCFLVCAFSASFYYGKDVRARSYFSEEEAIKRCETLSLASFFTVGSSEQDEYMYFDSIGRKFNKRVNYMLYKGKKYPLNSLLNKNIQTFSFFDQKKDSLRKIRLKDWLVNNQKDSVKVLMTRFMGMVKEHQLTANIDENKWLELVYNYPEFQEVHIVGNEEKLEFYDPNQYPIDGKIDSVEAVEGNVNQLDTINQYIVEINNEKYLAYKHFVPYNSLQSAYNIISTSWNNPTIDIDYLIVTFYFAIAFSILIFSFRVTSGKSWLIALISLGILNILFGVITAFIGNEFVYMGLLIVLTLAAFIYLLIILKRKQGKGISGATLVGTLWLLPAFIPILYGLILEIAKVVTGYNRVKYDLRPTDFPVISWFENQFSAMFYVNAALVFLMMLYMSFKIKKWKGVAES